MAHHFVEREGRRLHAAACWCWRDSNAPQLGRLAPVVDRPWWARALLALGVVE
jgi:hypothetical protein